MPLLEAHDLTLHAKQHDVPVNYSLLTRILIPSDGSLSDLCMFNNGSRISQLIRDIDGGVVKFYFVL